MTATPPTTHQRRPLATVLAAALLVLVAVVALAMLAVSRTDTATDPRADAPAADGAVGGSGRVDQLTLTSTDGDPVVVPGEQTTVLFFMATWCASCIEGAQAMADLEETYPDVRFVAVETSPNTSTDSIEEFRGAAGDPSHPYVIDKGGYLLERYAVRTLDTTVVINDDGDELGRVDGTPINAGELKAFLDDTLPA